MFLKNIQISENTTSSKKMSFNIEYCKILQHLNAKRTFFTHQTGRPHIFYFDKKSTTQWFFYLSISNRTRIFFDDMLDAEGNQKTHEMTLDFFC